MTTAKYQAEWLARPGNREKDRKRQRDAARNRRTAVLAVLGGRCVRCGFSDPRALQVDHIHDDGHEERKALGPNFTKTIARKILAGDTERYQLLCANCNWIKRHEADLRRSGE